MVKFLPFGLFDSQNVLPSSGDPDSEPIDIIPALNDFLISTRGGEIVHYSIGSSECSVVNKFETRNDQIQSIHYIPSNDSILTLEKESDKSTINVIRIYQNWRQYQSPLNNLDNNNNNNGGSPVLGTSPGINSLNTTSNQLQLTDYKIPVPSTVVAVNTCPITSRVIVATQSSVSVWGPIYNIQSSTLISHFEKILDIQIENVVKVAIYESYISYSTNVDVKVLSLNLSLSNQDNKLNKSGSKILLMKDNSNNNNNSNTSGFNGIRNINNNNNSGVNNGPSEITEDENYFEVCFDMYGQPTGKNQLPNLQSQFDDSLRKQGNSGEHEVLGPISDIEHGINVNIDSGYSLLSSTLLLNRKFSKDDIIRTVFFLPDSSLKNQLLDLDSTDTTASPSLSSSTSSIINPRGRSNSMSSQLNISGNSNSNNGPQSPKFKSISQLKLNSSKSTTPNSKTQGNNNNNNSSNQSQYMRFVVSTQKSGYLYNITKPTLLAHYLYANETVLCAASYSFYYTITTEGLETWTLRSCEGADDGDDIPSPIGFVPTSFVYPVKIAVVGDYLIILSKFTQEQLQSQSQPQFGGKSLPNILRSPSRTMSPKKPMDIIKGLRGNSSPLFDKIWSTYVLHHTPLQILYNDILEYTMKTEDKDEEVYHRLLLEGHFLLQSKLANQHRSNPKMNDMISILNFGIERKIYQSLLKKSSSLLGEYFFSKQKDYMRSALWFSSSDSDIEYVFNLLTQSKVSHQSLIYYLEHVLYDPQSYEILLNKEELCNKILEHYHINSPHRLPSLILESSISSYSQVLAIELLKKVSEQCDFDLVDRNKIYFALGLLYLDQNSIDDAISSFNQIPTDSLISLCLKNPKLLAPPGESTPTALCKILRQSTPWGLLDITIQLVSLQEITPNFGLTILLFSTTTFTNGISNPIYHHNDYDLDSLLLKIYLEWFLSIYTNNSNNINSNKKHMNSVSNSQSSLQLNYSNELVSIFLKYLINLYVQDIHRFRGEDFKLFHSLKLDIAKILNINSISMKPSLSKSSSNLQQPQVPIQNQMVDEFCHQWMLVHLNTFLSIPQWLSKLPPFQLENPSAKDEVRSLLSPLYYKKLQSLLSVNKIKDFEFMETIESIFKNNSENIMFLSLKLSCLPLLDRVKEGIELAVDTNIQIILDYSLHFCKSEEDWPIVLNSVLRKYNSEGKTPSDKETIVKEYEKILDHLTGVQDPEAFLHLLPSTGKMDYFLPFIEKSFSNYQAKLLKTSLSYQLIEMENESM